MRPVFDGWAVLTFFFWMGFCWLLCVRRMFWGNVKKNIVTSLLFAIAGIALIFLATRPWINTIHIRGVNPEPLKYTSEILNLVGSMCLTLSLALRVVIQPNPMPNPRILVSDENEHPLRGTWHIIDEVRVRVGDIVILTNQNRARDNGPWEVRKQPWIRPQSTPVGSHSFGSWFVANCGLKYSNTLWVGSLCRNDIIGTGELDWKQINPSSKVRTFVSLDIPCNIGETAKYLLRVGVLPHQITSSTQEDVVRELLARGLISQTSVGILLHKPFIPEQNNSHWGPRVKAAMRLLIHSGEFDYAKDAYENAVVNGLEHYMKEAEVIADFDVRVRNETPDLRNPTRFERDEVI
jgi:hypothetical protein